MAGFEVEIGADRHDLRRIDRGVAAIVVLLDVAHVHGFRHARPLVKLAQIARQVGIVGYPADVALEVPDIDRVEADERREEPPVGFGDPVAGQVARGAEPLVQRIQCLKQRTDGALIGLLRRREARL